MSGRTEEIKLLTDTMVDMPHGEQPAASTHYADMLASWTKGTVETAYGVRQLAAVSMVGGTRNRAAPIPMPEGDEVWIPEALSSEWQLKIGSQFTMRLNIGGIWHELNARVAGAYEATTFDQPLLVNSVWLANQGVSLVSGNRALYEVREGFEGEFGRYVRRVSPKAVVITPQFVAGLAREIVSDSFVGSLPAVSMLAVLLVLGIGTIYMLTFMDSKRELSVLKSMGMRPSEAGALFILEGSVTVGTGIVAGIVVALAIRGLMPFQLAITVDSVRPAVTLALFSGAIGILVPYRLARTSTVNELMLDRPIPLLRQTHTNLSRRYPALEEKLGAGLKCLKLSTPDGAFAGIAFRGVGQPVKQGETVAWDSFAWGFGERMYVSPCDGKVVECDLQQGLISIRPHQEAANN